MVYGVDDIPPSTAAAPAPALAETPPAPVHDPWTDAQDPWSCQPCAPEAQPEQWHLDPFGKGKGKNKGKDRGPMACFNCLGLGHPERLCASPWKAGEQKLGNKCKTCGGYGHDTPMCASLGGGKYSPPAGKGKGKDSPPGKGKGQSQWGKGQWGKGKGKVSAFDDYGQGGAWDPYAQPQWPPGLAANEPWMQAAAQPQWPGSAPPPPPWPGAAAQPQWPGAPGSIRSLAGGFSSLAPARPRAEKLHAKPLPTASEPAPVATSNRFQALEDSAPVKLVIDSGGAAIIQERIFKLDGFIKPQKLKKKRKGKEVFLLQVRIPIRRQKIYSPKTPEKTLKRSRKELHHLHRPRHLRLPGPVRTL